MARATRVLGLVLLGLYTLATPIAVTGILYLIGSGATIPGPALPNALPLDELPGHAGRPALVFAGVWAAAGLLLGLLARLARVERLTAALLFAVVVGAFLVASTGVSIFVVRQIPVGESFEAALRVQSVYVAALFAGLGGALLGTRQHAGSRRAPVVLALFVAASGVLDVASALTPAIDSRLRLIENATPNFVPRLASALIVPAGLALIVLARGLWRRRRRAWQLTLILVLAAAALHLLKGLDYEEAAASVALALALVARRHDFEGRGDPGARSRVLALGLAFVTAIFAYGAIALWINRIAVDRPYTLAFALKETGESLIGLHLHGSEHLSGPFGSWFPLSVLLLGIAAAFWLLWLWLAPWRYRLSQHARARERAHQLVESFGVDTLAPFALRADKSYFFGQDERAFLAYKVVAGVAVVSGDPVGPEDAVRRLVPSFLTFARERDWRVAVLGAGEHYLDLYRRLGLRVLYHGDEAVVEVAGFSLEGRAIRKVRQSVSRLERQGYSVEVRYAREVDDDLSAELEELSREWRGAGPAKGFTMELDTLFTLEGEDALFTIGCDPDGVVRGFLHFAVVWPGKALSLSSMPRAAETPNGFNEWLVVETIEWGRRHDFERVSMNFAPFAAVLAPEQELELSRTRRFERRALRTLKGHGFQLDNLLTFNRKFLPRWEPRFLVYERQLDLPRVGVAGLAAEGYLPLVGSKQ